MLMYGSNFWRATFLPRETSSRPIDAAAMPFPRDETTPPVTKMKRVRGRDSGIRLWRASLERPPADTAEQTVPRSGLDPTIHPGATSCGPQQLLRVASRGRVRLLGAEHAHELADDRAAFELRHRRTRGGPRGVLDDREVALGE